jgi:hypothetical protein
MQHTTVWENRWQALAKTLAAMKATAAGMDNPTFSAWVASLGAFGEDQFHYFLEGFGNGRLLPSPEYPPASIYRATLDQISYDITAVQQAIDQRKDGTADLQNGLKTASALAQNSLNVGIDGKLARPAAVVTYFIKAPNIRVIPYAPLAVVGLPFTSLTVPRDFLALPHETGHYVYHHGPGLAAALHRLLPAMPAWGAPWLEEMFADVYGCLVAGPVIGLDFQDLLADNSQAAFVSSDGRHPVDAIRPFIYTAVLRQLGFVNAAKALKTRWKQILRQRGNPQSFFPDDDWGEIPLRVGKAFVQETAVAILDFLLTSYQLTPAPWTADLAAPQENPEQLYAAFARKLPHLAKTAPNQLLLEGKKIVVLQPDGKKVNARPLGSTQTWRDWFKVQSRQHPHDSIPAVAWTPIFSAGNWPVKGPEGSGGGG